MKDLKKHDYFRQCIHNKIVNRCIHCWTKELKEEKQYTNDMEQQISEAIEMGLN